MWKTKLCAEVIREMPFAGSYVYSTATAAIVNTIYICI